METVNKIIEAVILKEHTSVWGFCSAIEDAATYEEDSQSTSRAISMLVQGLREWASYRQSARKEYEQLIRQSLDKIAEIDNNLSIYWELDSDRVKEYNAKAEAQVQVMKTAAYIIGLENETLKQLFAIVTTLQFAK